MKGNFKKALEFSLLQEGVDSNHPDDDGGKTRYGISSRYHPAMWLSGPPTREQAEEFYRREFWNELRCDDLPEGVDIAVFDAAIPSGPRDAAIWLQKSCGAKADGWIGPKTIAAAMKVHPSIIIRGITARRQLHYIGLADFHVFGAGWFNRSLDCYRTALANMAREPLWNR